MTVRQKQKPRDWRGDQPRQKREKRPIHKSQRKKSVDKSDWIW